jgi:hypothetical protein
LEGLYEVALVELMYPVTWKYRVDGSLILKSNKLKATCEVKFYAYETLETLVENLNEFFQTSDVQMEISYNTKTKKIYFIIPPASTLEFTNGIEREFGFKANNFTGIEGFTHISDKPIRNIINSIDALYIYSDIVEYQIVGDINAPLLQVVASTETKTNPYVDKIYDSPHYVPVSRTNIESIEIDIRSDLGKPIYFQSGRVMVKLHFRRKHLY